MGGSLAPALGTLSWSTRFSRRPGSRRYSVLKFNRDRDIPRQDDFLVVITQLLVTESAVVTRDAVLTAGHVGALMLRNRRSGVERDRVPNYLCTALPHIMRKGKGAADVRSHNLEATIGSATARKAEIVQKHRHCDQFGIRSKRATLCQLRAIEPRAHHMVEKPRLRFRFCLVVGVPNGGAVGEKANPTSAHRPTHPR